jgi:hypothetical protein
MKKTIFKVQLLLAGAVALMLTSCLGDSENSRSSNGEFVYITNLDGMKVAASSYSGYLASEELSQLSEGDCALIDYKVNFEKMQGNAYVPEYLKIDWNNVFEAGSQFEAMEINSDPYEKTTANDIFLRISPFVFNSFTLLGDRWLFEVMYKKYEGEEVPQLQIFFNPDNQIETDLDRGFVTLDAVLSRMGGAIGEPTGNTTMKSVVNFSELRNILKSYAKEEPNVVDASVVKIKFRYPVALTTTDEPNEKGYKLETTYTSNSYYLIYDLREY